jgi:hypothetical protein
MASIARFGRQLKDEMNAGSGALAKQWAPQEITQTCVDCGYTWRDRDWGPLQTIWTFLLQVLHANSSCRQAVALTLTQQAAADPELGADEQKKLPSDDPSAYCQARKRLPLKVLQNGVAHLGQHLREQVSQTISWCGRRVWLVDGTTCSMPDTPQLQQAFWQPSGQAPGCGFPVAKVVAMFCWASGAVLEAAIGPHWRSELALWHSLWHLFARGDILVADRFYCTFADMAGLLERGCDTIVRLHHKRPHDLRRGRRLGPNDRLMTWQRPARHNRPAGMLVSEWRRLPQTLTVRILRIVGDIPGFRSRTIDIATTLLDPVAYPAEKIAALYRDRWLIELRFRDLKTTLGMDVLRSKTPDVVRKEIYMHLLAYNLIRGLMWQAASRHGRPLHRLSFAGTVDRMNAVAPYLQLLRGTDRGRALWDLLLRWIAEDELPYRPNRIEPRAVKRRPKQYDLLNRPRRVLQRALRRGRR